jgi:hypothetical protein
MIPQDFYFCQPPRPGGPSCARCCGIYNYRGHDRKLVTGVLRLQTGLMAGWDGSEADLPRVRAEIEAGRPEARFAAVHNCPFAGFIDQQETRVGCLIHPTVRGSDRRDLSFYGPRTCGEARCLAHDRLSPAEAEVIREAAGDWYRYGLALADLDLIRDFFILCSRRLGGPVTLADAGRSAAALGDFLRLLEHWPLARDPGRFGRIEAIDLRHYEWIYAIDYERLGAARPFHHRIIVGLGSVIADRADLAAAVAAIDARVDDFARDWIRGGGAFNILPDG